LTAQAEQYLDMTELQNIAEETGPVESDDYTGFELLPVGTYVSTSRTIKGKQKDNGDISFEINLVGLEKEGQMFARGGLRTWVTTKQYQRPNVTGLTSGAAEYLRSVGFDVKGKGTSEIIALMAESQNLPVGVFIGRTNRTSRLEDGTYEKETLKTRDFNIGTKDEPNYASEVTVQGQKFQAKHKVQGFKKIA
jgi:hypothetical protein